MNCRQVVAHRDNPVDRDSSHLLFLGISVEQEKRSKKRGHWKFQTSKSEKNQPQKLVDETSVSAAVGIANVVLGRGASP